MKIGLFNLRARDLDRALEEIARVLTEDEADSYFFGEGFLQGQYFPSLDYGKDIYSCLSTGARELVALRKLARERRKNLGFGFYENYRGGIYNSYMIIDKRGELVLNHQSLAPWGAGASPDYRRGKKLSSFLLDGRRFMLVLGEEFYLDSYLPYIIEYDSRVEAFLWPRKAPAPEDLAHSAILAAPVLYSAWDSLARLEQAQILEEGKGQLILEI